jgi:hypothetical protein
MFYFHPGTQPYVVKFMVQIVENIIFIKPDPLSSMSKIFQNYVRFRKMHKFRTTPTQAKTRGATQKQLSSRLFDTFFK